MKNSALSRLTYRFILRIHPRPFRERFSDEMLWIFDEECRRGAGPRLLCDGAFSLLRQHAKSDDNHETTTTGIGLLITNSGISPIRFVQAGLTASILLLGFIFVLGKSAKPLVPIRPPGATHHAPRRLQAPARIESLPNSGK
jgi:hypothetical protein